jgi:TRAP-type C4-dicarboxylate transport system permease small subunit
MRRFLAWSENVAAVFLLAIAALTAVNVVLRYAVSVQIPDHFDIAKFLQAIALFWGIAIATYYGGHIAVDVLWEALGKGGRRVLDILATVVTFCLLAPLAWMMWSKVLTAGTQQTSDLRLPITPFLALAAIGATATAVLALARLAELVRGRTHDYGETVDARETMREP